MVAGGGLPKCRHFSNLQWPSVGSKWPSPTGRNQSNAKPRLSPGHFCASAFSNAAFFCIDPLDEPTIHKSQGSEYPAVVIPVLTQHYAMLQRNLLYTGVTRGKRLVVLVGQKKAVAIAVKNVSGRRRWSKLNEWLLAKL